MQGVWLLQPGSNRAIFAEMCSADGVELCVSRGLGDPDGLHHGAGVSEPRPGRIQTPSERVRSELGSVSSNLHESQRTYEDEITSFHYHAVSRESFVRFWIVVSHVPDMVKVTCCQSKQAA